MSDLGVIVAGVIGSSGKQSKSTRRIGGIVANITISERHVDEMVFTEHPVAQGSPITDHAYRRPTRVTITCAWSNSVGNTGGGPLSSVLGNGILGSLGGALINKVTGVVTSAVQDAGAKLIGGSAVGNLAVGALGNKVAGFGASVNTGKGKGTTTGEDIYNQLVAMLDAALPFKVFTGKRQYPSMVMEQLVVDTDKMTENSLVAVLVCRVINIVTTQVVSVSAPAGNQAAPQKTAAPAEAGTKQIVQANPAANLQLGVAMASAWLFGSP